MHAEIGITLPDAFSPHPSSGLSLRVKGILVICVLVAYAVLVAGFVLYQKTALFDDFKEIQEKHELGSALTRIDLAVFHTLMEVVNIDDPDRAELMHRIKNNYSVVLSERAEITNRFPDFNLHLVKVDAALARADTYPSASNLIQLIQELGKSKAEFARLIVQVNNNQKEKAERYRLQWNSVSMMVLLLVMFGLVLFGSVIGLFFSRLTEDLRVLQSRALDIIVNGYRGEPLEVKRTDEVGQLMGAVNHMATVLDKREKELMIERQKYFHQEKMAAVGALAAGVAHEIGNPIAAISGIVQEMRDARASGACNNPDHSCHNGMNCQACTPGPDCKPSMIQTQIHRLAAITREIAEFASPQPVDSQLLDLNALVRSTSSFVRYDHRLQNVSLELDLDSQLPAIVGVGDQLTQVVFNLLVNSMDALEGIDSRPLEITISTRACAGGVLLSVGDNGHGMEKEIVNRAFEAFFTTKPAGKGTGLGLSLCYSIVHEHGGNIEIESMPDAGTRMVVFLPFGEIVG